MKDWRIVLKEVLEGLLDGTIEKDVEVGICQNASESIYAYFKPQDTQERAKVSRIMSDASGWLYSQWRYWPEYSGRRLFPVPPTRGDKNSDRAIDAFMANRNLWVGEYGALRLELLEFVLERLNKKIIEEKVNG